jgi:hypothetical protein
VTTHSWRLRGVALGIVTLACVMTTAVTASSSYASPVLDLAAQCVHARPAGYHVLARSAGGRLQVLGPSSQTSAAQRLMTPVETTILGRLANAFGEGSVPARLPHSAHGGPYQIFFVPPSELGPYGGVTLPYCEYGSLDAIALPIGDSDPVNYAAHELCHAYIDGLLHRHSPDSWFEEALCTYYAFRLSPNPARERTTDSWLFDNPAISLDSFRQGGAAAGHEYGEQRFLQWLALRLGDRFSPFARAVILATPRNASSARVDQVVTEQLSSRGRSFDGDLGEFWADHLLAPADQPGGSTGPAAHSHVITATPGRHESFVEVPPMASKIMTVRLAPGVLRIAVLVFPTRDPTSPAQQTWVFWGSQLRDVSTVGINSPRGLSQAFCVGESRQPGSLVWPGEIRLALTNPTHRVESVQLWLNGDDQQCWIPRV